LTGERARRIKYMTSVKKNFLYSSFLTTANYIFPLLTFPYVSRVLGVENIGIVNFVDSIINYFVLFSMMGISIVGIREIAKHKSDKEKLAQTFSGLLLLNTIFTFIGIIALILTFFTIPELYRYSELMGIGLLKLIFNLFLIEWFYKGLEDFKYITIRTLGVKVLYVTAIFIFIRNSSDYSIYYLLTVLMIVVNAIINFIHAFRFTRLSTININTKEYLKPVLILGLYIFLTSMYTSFNVAYLGFVSDVSQVGYYTTAIKLYTIIIALFSAFTGVMLPRMSNLAENNITEFKRMYLKSIDVLLCVSTPVIIFAIIMAPEIILLIAGNGYEGAIIPMRIVMPLIFVIGYEQILVIQALMPLKKDKVILRNSLFGAILSLMLNMTLVSSLKAVGSSISWVICEVVILILSQIAINKSICETFPVFKLLKNISCYIPLCLIYWLKDCINCNIVINLLILATITVIYFICIQFIFFKNGLCRMYLSKVIYRACN